MPEHAFVDFSNQSGPLPAWDGNALTNLNAANLGGTLPSLDAGSLYNLNAANLTGSLPSLDATNLTNLNAGTLFGTLSSLDAGNLYNLNGGNLQTNGSVPDGALSMNVTVQGNSFNGANQLVQLDSGAKLPAVDGSQLTNLPSGSFSEGDPHTWTAQQTFDGGNLKVDASGSGQSFLIGAVSGTSKILLSDQICEFDGGVHLIFGTIPSGEDVGLKRSGTNEFSITNGFADNAYGDLKLNVLTSNNYIDCGTIKKAGTTRADFPGTGESSFNDYNGATWLQVGTGGTRIGTGSNIATNATAGFLRIPTMNGTPSGTPTYSTGCIVLDYSTNKLYAYNGSAWKSVTLT